jgi:hypothetical protein
MQPQCATRAAEAECLAPLGAGHLGGSTMLRNSFAATALIALAALVPPSLAQAPKPGKEYIDSVDLGFRIKMPDGWDFVPGSPADVNLIGKYTAPADKGILDTSDNSYWAYQAWIVKFDRRAKTPPKGTSDGDHKIVFSGAKDLTDWLGSGGVGISGWGKPEEKKDSVINKVNATEYLFRQTKNASFQVAVYACVYKLKPDVEVAVVFNGPGEDKKWSKFDAPFRSMAKSFKLVDAASVATGSAGASAGSYRDQKWRALQDQVAKNPGWHLDQSPNYFFVYAVDDKEFIAELKDRLEAIHSVYLELYPPALGKELRALGAAHRAKAAAEEKPADKPEGDPKPTGPEDTTSSSAAHPDVTELATCSVVRICANSDQYQAYGGPPSTAGYWNWVEEELVIFDDKASGGRGDTWLTMNHEAFHQYIHYLVGHIDPQSWFNEGTGDFFSGYEYTHKKFSLKPASWRQRTIQEDIRTGKFVPLKVITRYSQREYYEGDASKTKYKTNVFDHYAEGWAIIYFLRTGEKKAKGWNPAWNSILDTYLRTLVEFGDVDKAVDKAFAGVDWDALEACWKEYILNG